MFNIGDEVLVAPKNGDFEHEFSGVIHDIVDNMFIVSDQDGAVCSGAFDQRSCEGAQGPPS